MKLGSLFDGIGGFPRAAELCGIEPVWASEIEPFPIAVTKHHFPNMKHLGDVTKINGAEIEPVDIITFGSPCQDLSVAGKRAGLDGERSGLFFHAIRIIHEMRGATDGRYPRFALWENVPGALSSNNGADFTAAINAFIEVGALDITWRVLDAQYFGVPQRRRRIFVVADFGGERAGEILLEREGVSGDTAESREARKEVAAGAGDGVGGAIPFGPAGQHDIAHALRAQASRADKPSSTTYVVEPVTLEGKTVARTLTARSDSSPCIDRGQNVVIQLYDMTHADEVMRSVTPGLAPTLNSRMGTGGNQVPVLMQPIPINDQAAHEKGRCNGLMIGQEGDPMYTLTDRDKHSVFCLQGSMIGRQDHNGSQGDGINNDVVFMLNTVDRHAVAYPDPANSLLAKANLSHRLDQDTVAIDCRNLRETEQSGTLQSKETGGYSLNYQNPVRIGYAVRRLTPTECERLMGFPDGWTDIVNPGSKTSTDTARYKALGNSVAVPVVEWLMRRLAEVTTIV